MSVIASQLIGRVSIEGAERARSEYSQIGKSADSAKTSMSEMRSGSHDLSDSLGGRLVGGLHSAVGGLIDFGKNVGMAVFGYEQLARTAVDTAASLLKPAAAAEMVQTSLTTMLGSTKAAKDEMQQLDQFASQTPFETMAIDQAALKMQAVGISTQNVIPDLKALGDGLAALGKTSGADLDMVVSSFDKIQTSGHLTGDVMMSLSDMGINAWGILEKQTGKTHDELDKMISGGLYPAADAMRDLTQGIEANPLYKGQMATQANTMTGLISTLKSNWDQMLASFGSPILKALEPIISNIGASLASPGFKDFASGIGQGIVDIFSKLGPTLSSLSPSMTGAGNSFKEFAQPVREIASLLQGQFVDAFKFANQQVTQIATWVQKSGIIKDMGQELRNLAHITLDLAEILIRARGVVQDIEEHAFAKFAPIIEKILPPLIKLQVAIDAGIAGALQYVRPYIDQALKAFEKFADGVIDRVTPIIDKYMPYIIQGTQDVEKVWVAVWPYLQTILEGTFQSIVGIVQIAWSLVSGIINIGLDLLSGNWKQAWADMKDMLGGIWAGIQNLIGGQLQIVRGLLSGVEGFVDGLLVQPFRNAASAIGSAIGWIQGLISNLTGSISNVSGTLHNLGIPGFASGTDYAPGGVAVVGERGPELMYLPRGARVVPAAQTQQMLSGSTSSGGAGQPIILVMNGREFARGYMPYHVEAIRHSTGVRF